MALGDRIRLSLIGQTLSHFKITAKLGEGGMGEVYRAEDTKLGREVAIKVLPEDFTADPERLARFEREAKVLASLDHPSIAGIYEVGESDGLHFLVMQLALGETLAERIERGPVPLEEAIPIAMRIAAAVDAAHENGIIHRDLKPANVMVSPDGQAKVLDFGLAKAFEGDGGGDSSLTQSPTLTAGMTQAGVLLGTAAYMSPEQARGQEAGRQSDIWSFGVLLREMITGRRTFAGDTVSDTLAAVLRADLDDDELPEIPRAMRRLLQRCLEREAPLRLRCMGDARLELLAAGEQLAAPEPEVVEAEAAVPPRTRRLPLATGVLALAAGLAAGVFFPREAPPRDVLRLQTEIAPGVPLVTGIGANFAFSPDERSIVLLGEGENGTSLFVRDLDSLEARPLSDTATARRPFFSPDGEWIGYDDGSRLRKVSKRGGAPLTLAEGVGAGRGSWWSTDGYIYYTPTTRSGILRVSAEGGEAEPLTELRTEEPAERSHRWPQALPDGKSILFTVQPLGVGFNDANLEVLDLETRERTVVYRGGSTGRYLPSGHLVFVSSGTLYAAPFDLSKLELTRAPAPVLDGVSYSSRHGGLDLTISENGTLLYLAAGAEAQQSLELVRADAEGQSQPLSATRRFYRAPRVSPDGRSVLFSDSTGGGSAIWSLDLERDVATRLTFSESGNFGPLWSPDGTSFVFTSTRSGSANLYLKSAEGTSEAEPLIPDDSFQIGRDWSPDSRYVMFQDFPAGEEAGLRVLDLESREIEPYLVTKFNEGGAKFSPDGKWVAYASNESGPDEIYVRAFPVGAGKWRVSSSGGRWPVWSPDGRTIYYRGADDRFYAVPVEASGANLTVGSAVALFDDHFVRRQNGRHWDVMPDGSFLFLRSDEVLDEVAVVPVMVFNWFEELKRLVPLEK